MGTERLLGIYELSTVLHRNISCSAEKLGPIRISALQEGQRQMAMLPVAEYV